MQPESMALWGFLEWAEHIGVGMVQHLSVHGAQHIIDSAGHMGMGFVVQHDTVKPG
jgi:hypothetical protein